MWRTLLSKIGKAYGPAIISNVVDKCSSFIHKTEANRKQGSPIMKDNSPKKSTSRKTPANKNDGVSTFFKDDAGEFSVMRLMFVLMITMVLGLRIWGCIIENRFIPWDWPEVSLLSACFGGKALQTKYEGMSSSSSSTSFGGETTTRSKYSSPED